MKTDIDKIKDLLFGNEKKALDAITRRLEKPESRTADVSDVLPESIMRSHADGKRLVPALQEPVEQCLKNAIRRDPEDFADTLFPVIGRAIRKSIAEAMRSLTQSMNEGIENSLSVSTRYKAWRAGMPLAQYILQRSILYRVEQAYLIKRDDGLLIEHLQHEDIVSKDTDAVSAMFTAIQDFIQDSFAQEGGQSLTTAELGDLTLVAVHGPHASLVCVVRGVPQAGLRSELLERLEQIHLRHGDALSKYDGDGRIVGIEMELEKCLALQQRRESAADDNSAKSGIPFPVLLILLGILLFAGWLWFSKYNDAKRIDNFRAAMDSTPGIVVNQISRDDGQVVVRGLRDPLSNSPLDLAPAFLIDPTEVKLELSPYQSLDAAIVERRARRILMPPPGVGLSLEGNRLRLSGSAPVEWKERAKSLAVAIPGVESVDITRMALTDAEILSETKAVLRPPDSVMLNVSSGRLSATGMAPQSWLLEAQRRLPLIAGRQAGDLSGVAAQERVRMAELLSLVEGAAVFFAGNDILVAGQDSVLDRLTAQLREIVSLASRLNVQPQIRITGYSDGTGSREINRTVELARADRVGFWLIDAGIAPGLIQTQASNNVSAGSVTDPALRKAEIIVGVVEGG